MINRLRPLLPVAITAAIVSMVFAGGPTVAPAAFDALNADKVDGKHAVGASANVSQRAGKLVATDSIGRLPNNIIAKTPNADKLDGLDSTAFAKGPRRSCSATASRCLSTAWVQDCSSSPG